MQEAPELSEVDIRETHAFALFRDRGRLALSWSRFRSSICEFVGPRITLFSSKPPRAAYSHSASVGRRTPTQA